MTTATPAAGPRADAEVDRGSFRDPSGHVFRRDGRLLRQVNRSFEASWEQFKASGLLTKLQAKGHLIPHQEVATDLGHAPDDAVAVLAPEEVDFISYPYEWSFGQLKDAALLTLEAQAMAAAAGFEMRDATPYNVQLHKGAPILIDTLSFEPADAEAPWIAYRQFCETFLAPLALMAHRDVRCGLFLREFIDGIPIDLAATLLPGRTKLDVGLASHVHAHARAKRAADAADGPTPRAKARAGMSPLRKAALLDNLQRTVEKLHWSPEGTAWAGYAGNTSYGARSTEHKDELVGRFLEAAGGTSGGTVVWDLGANTGRFSAIAARQGSRVVAWDIDPGATELHYRDIRKHKQERVLPLLLDLANPSPATGWVNEERRSFLQRADADTVLALALVHHLAIGRNIPLAMVADLFARLAPKVILEFVPKSDPMTTTMLATRRDIFPDYSIEGLRAAFAPRFVIDEEAAIEESGRTLLRMTRR